MSEVKPKAKLKEHEVTSSTWKTLEQDLQERLQILRQKNDHSLPLEKTERLRGAIAEIKRILAIADPDIAIEDEF